VPGSDSPARPFAGAPSEPVKCYYSQAFWLKITALPVALLFTLTIRHRVAIAGTGATRRTRLVAVVSLTLWFTVAAAGGG
jgi:hypothetical protein